MTRALQSMILGIAAMGAICGYDEADWLAYALLAIMAAVLVWRSA